MNVVSVFGLPPAASNRRAARSCALALAMASAAAFANGPNCALPGPVRGDYIGDRRQLEIVERFHFTQRHALLMTNARQGQLGADFDYTLRSFPNHHRALVAMRKLGERERTEQPAGAQTTVECYFMRAVKFRPDDTVARMLYADFLIDRKRADDALVQLRAAEQHAGDRPLTHYNLGLMFAKLARWDAALAYAHKAYGAGVPAPALREQLAAAGQWKEVPAAAPSAPASAASSSTGTS